MLKILRVKSKRRGAYTLGYKAVYAILFVIFIMLVFLYLRGLFSGYKIEGLDNALDVDASMLIDRLTSDPDCLAHFDEDIGRTYPGLITSMAFRDKDKCLEFVSDNFKIKVLLDGKIIYSDKFGSLEIATNARRNVLTRTSGDMQVSNLTLELYLERPDKLIVWGLAHE